MVTLDLKDMSGKYILWMVCSFTKFMKGVVLKDKTAETIIKTLYISWCMDLGYPPLVSWLTMVLSLEMRK